MFATLTKVATALLPWGHSSGTRNHPGWSSSLMGMWPNFWGNTGESVDLNTAKWLAASQRCVALLSDAMSASPMRIVKTVLGGGTEEIFDTDAARTIRSMSYHDRECLAVSLLWDGNGYGRLRKNERGGITAIEPISSWRVLCAVANDGSVWYRIGEDTVLNQPAIDIPASDMVHIRFRPTTSASHFLLGLPPLAAAAKSLEMVLRVTEAGTTFYRNMSLPSMILSTEQVLSADQLKELRRRWEEQTSGPNLGGVPILTAGLKAMPIPYTNALNAQMEEMSRLSIAEISRCYGVPLSLLSENTSLNFATAAESNRSFYATTLAPLARRVGDALARAVLTREEIINGATVEIDLSDLVLGYGEELAKWASGLTNAGILSINEARNRFGLADVEGGDVLRSPVNTSPLPLWIEGKVGAQNESAIAQQRATSSASTLIG